MPRAVAFACALGLAACAAVSQQESPATAPTAPAEAAPLSPERARFERFKQGAPAADPRAAFARDAEAEASRRRSEALGRAVPAADGGVESELIGRQLAESIEGRSGCFEEEPDLRGQDDWIRHRALTRGDFLATPAGAAAKPELSIPDDEVGAIVWIRFACVAKSRLDEPEPGRFVVEIERVSYLALMSRRLSWWNPAVGDDEWVLRHEQLHFDVAELIAHELSAKAAELRERLHGVGPDPQAAIADFRARWTEHMREQQESFRSIELAYDRETRHGNDHARQTEWFARVKRGIGAVRAGLAAGPVLVP